MGIGDGQRLSQSDIDRILAGTLVRKIENFSTEYAEYHYWAKLNFTGSTYSFTTKSHKLPSSLPETWLLKDLGNGDVEVLVNSDLDMLIPATMPLGISSGANLPSGFNPGNLYNSHHHPRGLSMTIYGMSDALNSMGIDWEQILKHISPDQIAVYAGSALGQIDKNSLAGLMCHPLKGGRASSKMLTLSLAEMPADFINSYILNSVGSTGANTGACASFLYCLKQGIMDIESGKARVVVVGGSEAPIEPEIIRGFSAMGALITDEQLKMLDNSNIVNHRRACRPFSTNMGFVLGEAAQFLILMDDELAVELGANIFGSVAGVYINADGNKTSISKPGIGNYISVAKSVALAKALLGSEGLQKTFVQAHGTGTPQNRTTESHILNEVAKTFSIKNWPIAAVKSYIGHTVSASGGDQILASLGAWQYGWIPGIKTIDHIATDVFHANLNILMDHYPISDSKEEMQASIINSKGFGGNNATGVLLSPAKTLTMLHKKYGEKKMSHYKQKNEIVKEEASLADSKAIQGKEKVIYNFGENIIEASDISMTEESLVFSKTEQSINLKIENPFQEYT